MTDLLFTNPEIVQEESGKTEKVNFILSREPFDGVKISLYDLVMDDKDPILNFNYDILELNGKQFTQEEIEKEVQNVVLSIIELTVDFYKTQDTSSELE
jgi:hypothetical protein